MKALCLLVLLASTQLVKGQIDSLAMPQQDHLYYEDPWTPEFSLGVGVFIPQGRLNQYIKPSPVINLELDFPTRRSKSLDIVIQLVIPNQGDDFLYRRTIDTLAAKSTFLANYYVRFNKNLLPETVSQKLELSLGLGASTIVTDARNPFYEGAEGQNKYENVTTILVAPGIKWEFEPYDDTLLSLGLDLNYMPYRIEGALEERIGSLALIPRLTYRF